ncbi:DUF4157 domain-containing protein [bacterium]|nr:DUF4157 domain-containing protein [bacterium]
MRPGSLASTLGSGEPLPDETRQFLEAAFGRSLGFVRVHRGARAERLADHVGARAFTWAGRVVLAGGAPSSSSVEGRRLFVHEVAHAIQQADGRGAADPGALEAEARSKERFARGAGNALVVNSVDIVHQPDATPEMHARATRIVEAAIARCRERSRPGASGHARIPRLAVSVVLDDRADGEIVSCLADEIAEAVRSVARAKRERAASPADARPLPLTSAVLSSPPLFQDAAPGDRKATIPDERTEAEVEKLRREVDALVAKLRAATSPEGARAAVDGVARLRDGPLRNLVATAGTWTPSLEELSASVEAILDERARKEVEGRWRFDEMVALHRQLCARERQGVVRPGETDWVDRSWSLVERAPQLADLPPGTRQRLDRFWHALQAYELHDNQKRAYSDPEESPAARFAAVNLFHNLVQGNLATDKGRRFLETLDDLAQRDLGTEQGRIDRPYLSDAVLILSSNSKLRSVWSRGLPERMPLKEKFGIASVVADDVAWRLTATNRGEVVVPFIGLGFKHAGMTVGSWVGISQPAPDWSDEAVLGMRNEADAAKDMGYYGHGSAGGRRRALSYAAWISKVALKWGWGNCKENAAVVATRLHEKGVDSVELMSKEGDEKGGDHAFVVVNRDPLSNPGNPSTWGNQAFIVDAWEGGDVYMARHWNEKVIRVRAFGRQERLPGRGPIVSRARLPDP